MPKKRESNGIAGKEFTGALENSKVGDAAGTQHGAVTAVASLGKRRVAADLRPETINPPIQEPDYADLFEHAPVGYMLLDASGRIESINQAGAAILGWDHSWLAGKLFARSVVHSDKYLLHAYLRKVCGCEERVNQLLRVKNRQGRLVNLRLIGVRGKTVPAGAIVCRCIMIEVSGEQESAYRLRHPSSRLGAVERFEQPVRIQQLLDSVQRVLQLDAQDAELARDRSIVARRFARLTEREREVMIMVVSDLSTKEIANQLVISPRTVEHHREHVMVKMQARSIADLVAMAVLCDIHRLNFRTHPQDARKSWVRTVGMKSASDPSRRD